MFEEATGQVYEQNMVKEPDCDDREDGIVYPKFIPFFSQGIHSSAEPKARKLFDNDSAPEQLGHGVPLWAVDLPWAGFFRDGWL